MPGILLVVDDEMRFQELVTILIEAQVAADPGGGEVHVTTTGTAEGAREKFNDSIDLILLDQDLGPGKFGHEIAEWIRSTGSTAVVLALSSSYLASDREAFEAAGTDGFVKKANFPSALPYLIRLVKGHRLPVGQTFVEVYHQRIQEPG